MFGFTNSTQIGYVRFRGQLPIKQLTWDHPKLMSLWYPSSKQQDTQFLFFPTRTNQILWKPIPILPIFLACVPIMQCCVIKETISLNYSQNNSIILFVSAVQPSFILQGNTRKGINHLLSHHRSSSGQSRLFSPLFRDTYIP